MLRVKSLGILAFGVVIGCATALEELREPPADLSDAARVAEWVNTASPLTLAHYAIEPFVEGDLLAQDCPSTRMQGTSLHVRGDCTTEAGTAWHGTATVTDFDPTTGDGTYDMDGFGKGARLTGTARFETVEGVRHYWVDVLREPAAEDEPRMAISYQGSEWLEADIEVRDGAGTVTIEGWGEVHAQTTAQRRDHARCEHESLSGETRLVAGRDEAVITYDGEVDCDPRSTARWRLNGEERGELTGVSCASLGGAASLWALLPVLVVVRRRTLES